MTVDERQKIAKDLFEERFKILLSKGKAYSSNEDALSNFKRNAERLGVSKYQVWLIYFMKHIDSICNAIKDNPEYPQDKTEGLHGRIVDAENYLDILECLLTEDLIPKDKTTGQSNE